jgi:outer membrane protein
MIAPLLLAQVAAAQPDLKIGYVDLQRAQTESHAGRRAKEKFKVEVDKIQATLQKQKDSIERLKTQIEKKGSVMKESERNSLEEDYRKKLRDFERSYKDSQADLQRKDNELTGSIIEDLQGVIQEYGKREGYTLILEVASSAVLYGSDSADLTDKVIAEYNGRK